MKKGRNKAKKPVYQKIEDTFVDIAFAEAGELNARKQPKKIKKKEIK
jgi:hypothetical protein